MSLRTRNVSRIVFTLFVLTLAAFGIAGSAGAVNFFGTEKPKETVAPRPGAPGSFADTVEGLLPAVVNISSTQKAEEPQDFPEMPQFPPGSPFEDFFDQFMQRRGMDENTPAVPPASLGSGFVIDAEKGFIVTNNHVVRDAEDIRVTFQDNETLDATLVGHDEKTDLAVLKVDVTKKKLTAVKFGDSDILRVGDWIVAIGNPFGLGGTVTAGIVSARQRDINAGPYDDFIQTDASINRGNSGGPMFDLKGEVIGINTAIFSPSGGSIGIGFAIPSSLAKPVINQIIEFGRTRRGWLGVRIQNMTPEIAESLNLPKNEGALVASVMAKGPAKDAGLQAGDVILEFNGQRLNETRHLPRIVAETPIGSDVDIVYWRGGKENHTKVKVAELEKAEDEGLVETGADAKPRSEKGDVKIPSVGLTLSALSEQQRREYNVPAEVKGIAVTKVENMSEAAIKGFLEGDVIVEVNQQPVATPKEAADIIDKAQKAGRTSVLMLVNREGDVRFVALRLKDGDG
ncbi:MAG: DegQ family serine endoprotease [Alphaproteobacteria bacterium]|nr:DegQ family serine endoprotease [Alphaproteobacteria bacterium]